MELDGVCEDDENEGVTVEITTTVDRTVAAGAEEDSCISEKSNKSP